MTLSALLQVTHFVSKCPLGGRLPEAQGQLKAPGGPFEMPDPADESLLVPHVSTPDWA